MGDRSQRVDAYIQSRAEFARPILTHLRELVHEVCPEAREVFKWSFPCFMHHGILCSMAGFKAHCTFGFWHPLLRESEKREEAMGQFGRLTSLKDLPSDAKLRKLIKEAIKLNESGIKPPTKKRAARPVPAVPPDLSTRLAKTPAARKTFEALPGSCKREYIEWITEAKRPETREKRLATTIEWLSEGKRRNWKYENC